MNRVSDGGSGLRPRPRALLGCAAGGLAALGLAPFDCWFLSLPAFAALIAVAASAPSRRGLAGTLWIGGVGYFAVALHWIVEPFLVDIARHGWMAPFALVLMAAGMALFWGAAGWLAGRFFAQPAARVWAIAGMLALAEYLRATILTGFPWAHPGHVLIGSEMLALSALAGPHGLTAIVVLAAALGAALWLRRGGVAAAVALSPFLALGFVPLTQPAPDAEDTAPVVRLIQPNAPQHLKWLPEMIPVFFETGLDLTAAPSDPALGPPDLIVWPETSLPVLLERSDPARDRMAEASGDAGMIVGAQRFEGIRPRNTLLVLDASGTVTELYDKHRLAPFGEYLPLGDTLARIGLTGLAEQLQGGYRPGPGPAILDLGALGTAFPMICYEAVFPTYIRGVSRPDWMVHITNDAWFGTFSGPYQHLALARLRAAEQGLPVLRAANTGITAVIDARGAVRDALPLGTAGALDGRIPPALPPTIYSRIGDAPVVLIVLLATIGLAIRGARRVPLRPGA